MSISMSTTDVQRTLDNMLPEGKKCTSVTTYVVYTAKIEGEDVTVSVEPELGVEDVARQLAAQLGSAKNAAVEGEETPDEDAEDDEDEGEWVDDEAAPKATAKSKKKK